MAALVAQAATGSKPFEVVHGHGLAGSALPLTGVALPTVLTVYDTSDQGYLTQEALDASGLEVPESVRRQLMTGDRLSLLRAGTFAADVVAAPSSIVVTELRSLANVGPIATSLGSEGVVVSGEIANATVPDELSLSAEGTGSAVGPDSPPLRAIEAPRERPLHCVFGGIDYATNNPATDSALPNRYDAEGAWGKASCKVALFRELELSREPEVPLVVWTGPLVERAGVGTLLPFAARAVETAHCLGGCR